MTSPSDLAALMCSRLCHDMLSPVGAINNGLELLNDETDADMREKCMELLEQSARTSADKLKFFRLAFGAAGGFGEAIAVEEPKSLIEALIVDNKRLELDWAVSEKALGKPAVKVLLNLASLGIDALVRGGTLSIGAETRDGTTEIAIRASGKKIAFDPNIGAALDGTLPEDELSGRTAPSHLVRMLIDEQGGTLQCTVNEQALMLGVTLPGSDLIG